MEVLMQSETTITCPNCGTEFELSEVIINQVKGEYEEKFKLDIQEEKKKIKESVEKDLNDSYSQSLEDLKSQISEKDGKLKESLR
jgi:uncharacterized Zn finger protein (UPF0148 family)